MTDYNASFESWEDAMRQVEHEIGNGSELIFRADHPGISKLNSVQLKLGR